jgi:hypothetical protein
MEMRSCGWNSKREIEATAGLLQSQVDYVQAQDEVAVATGPTPRP